eukprot:PITA_17157
MNRTILKALNTSFISLKPKQELAQTLDRFRLIALCDVAYKIISKVVANRLKPLLPTLVSMEQSRYVEGRQILNNIIQADEVVHSLTSNRKDGMIMKLNIAKAYDKLNWTYIKKVFIASGFDHNWVRWVLALVTSSNFSILVNGSPSETFITSRGLRQGDSLSPFLFILMMEGLGRSIKHAKEVGMEVNLSKSKIFFFNINIAIQRNISRILGFQRETLPSKYLGVPLTSKPFHKIIWEPMINKLQDKIRKWTMRSLNLAGRLVLTKVVLQSIPVFMQSTLPAPKGVLQQFITIQRDFILGKGEDRKKWALVAWEKICKPKNYGVLGLDDPDILSKVLGAKLWWRWENRGLVQENSFWEIREGDLALFWEARWQQEPIQLKEDLEEIKVEADTKGLSKVKDFWDQTNSIDKWRTWRNFSFRDDNPLKAKAETLMRELDQRKILVSRGHDQLRWDNNNEGTFHLKEVKLILFGLDSHASDRVWQSLWMHQGCMKIRLFMWLVQHRKILTWDNIQKRGILGTSRCQLCEAEEETMEHLLSNCIFTSRLWDSFATIFQQSDRDKGIIINTLNNWRRNLSDYEVLGSAWALTPSFIIWNVWKERNNRIFKNEKKSSLYLFEQILK